MRRIYFATKNSVKARSLGGVLEPRGIEVVHVPLDLPEPRSDDLRTIAREKVLFAYEKIKKPCVALDSGFYIHSLNGFPKAFVNFALETIGIEGIMRLVQGKARECEFRNCLAYMDEGLAEPVYFESKNDGILSDAPAGEVTTYAWSALWVVFMPAGECRTLGEMSDEEYRQWRARRISESYASQFAQWLIQRYN